MKKFVAIALAFTLLFTFCVAAACNADPNVLVYLHDYDELGRTVTQPYNGDRLPVPVKEGSVFEGWYLDAAHTEPFADGTEMKNNFHLYAKWSALTVDDTYYTVTLVYNDEATDNGVLQVKEGNGVNLPQPNRAGYRFDGWWTAMSGGAQWTTQPITEDITLYAHWTANKPSDGGQGGDTPQIKTHTVTLNYNDGVTSNVFLTVNDGGTVSLPQPSRAGYRFDGWWTAMSGGAQWTTQPITEDITLYAHWTANKPSDGGQGGGQTQHTTHDFGDSYFAYVKCRYDGCNVYGRNEGARNYDNMCSLDDARKQQIIDRYNACTSASTVSRFISAFEAFEEEIGYLDSQYGWALLYYDVKDFDYSVISDFYDEMYINYCQLFLDANDKFGNSFWTNYGYDAEETLAMARSYIDAPDGDEADSILESYYDALQTDSSASTFNALYKQLVAVNNAEAASYGYDNYMEYAYKEIYNREYGEAEIKTMRNYIKQYIAPVYIELSYKLLDYVDGEGYFSASNAANENFYYGMKYDSVFDDNRDAVNYIGSYFGWLDNVNMGGKAIGFTNAVNDMFRTGKYFRGTGEGAYTTWMPDETGNGGTGVCFFQQGDDQYYGYDDAFTFVHEFGHYYENVHNGGVALSYDHDETQSQGDEMLFLAWLGQNKSSGISDGMEFLRLDSLTYMLQTIIVSAAVDELEWAAYTKQTTDNFDQKYKDILAWYIGEDEVENEETDYWYYVAFDNAGYYVSYAISALPAVEIYAIAQNQNLNAARTAYLKLFTYCESAGRMANYSYTGANGVLDFCGLGDPFETKIYTDIKQFADAL